MEKSRIYIVLSNNYTMVGRIVCLRERLFKVNRLGAHYSHASLSLDSDLHNMMSFARKKINNPFIAGLIKEDISAGMFELKSEKSKIAVIGIDVTKHQYENIKRRMNKYWRNRDNYKYNLRGVLRILFCGRDKKEIKRENSFFCSEWVNGVLKESGLDFFGEENLYTVSPSDFYCVLQDNIIYEGPTKEYLA